MSSYIKLQDPAFSWADRYLIEDFVQFFKPSYALSGSRAQVVEKITLSATMLQLTLRVNRKFAAPKAGQHILLTVEVNGVHQQRCYSVVSFNNNLLTLAIKRQGKVSNSIHQHINIGQYLKISAATGDFVLQTQHSNQPILLLATGSGITPIYAMLSQLCKRQHQQPIHLVYIDKQPILQQQILAMVQPLSNVHYHKVNPTQQLSLNQDWLEQMVGPIADYQTYMCGNGGFMQSIQTIWQHNNISAQLYYEAFAPVAAAPGTPQQVTFSNSGISFTASDTLLVSAEQAGLQPSFGCRRGLCNQCVCTKQTGVTRNIITGEVNNGINTPIKLCISQALSPVSIAR